VSFFFSFFEGKRFTGCVFYSHSVKIHFLNVFCVYEIILVFSWISQGTRAMEFMSVTNVGGPFQTHIQVQDTGVHTRRSVELLKDTSLLTLRRLHSRPFLTMTMVLMKILKPLVRTLVMELCFFIAYKMWKENKFTVLDARFCFFKGALDCLRISWNKYLYLVSDWEKRFIFFPDQYLLIWLCKVQKVWREVLTRRVVVG
jgi:hypothetical protein